MAYSEELVDVMEQSQNIACLEQAPLTYLLNLAVIAGQYLRLRPDRLQVRHRETLVSQSTPFSAIPDRHAMNTTLKQPTKKGFSTNMLSLN